MRFANVKILKFSNALLEILYVNFLFKVESIKNIHRVFPDNSQKDCAPQLSSVFVKPARIAISELA